MLLPSLLGPLLLWLLLPSLLGLLPLRLLLLSLLGSLLLRLLLPRLLGPLLLRLLLVSLLGPLLLCRWRRALPLPALLLFRLALFFALLVVLCIYRANRPKKQKQRSRTGSSNKSHNHRLLEGRYWMCTRTTNPFDQHRLHPSIHFLPP
jgi:hypothetical protein